MAEVEANVPKEAMDINQALRLVLKKALQHDGLARGLHEAARAVEKGQVGRCMGAWCHAWCNGAVLPCRGFG